MRWMRWGAACLWLGAGCAGEHARPFPYSEPGRHEVTILDTRQIVPGDGLPAGLDVGTANNNLDVIRFNQRVYLAFRTAPDHYASDDVRIHVVSSNDELTWTHEATFMEGTDLREPRFLVLGNSLFLYVTRLGSDAQAFTPMGVWVSERVAGGSWSDLVEIDKPGFVAWRTRSERGAAYMTAYLGGENIYLFNGEPVQIGLYTTTDGYHWPPVNPARPFIYEGGGSETDFTLTDEGDLLAVIRNEAGDDSGWGSRICRASAGDITNLSCVSDPKKYDSPLMFWYDGEAYLVGRRNVTEDGAYMLTPTSPEHEINTVVFELAYVGEAKRCSLWRYVQDEDRIAFVLDLPSRGDTCFPAWLSGNEPDEIVIYNYSSAVDGPDLSWRDGQLAPTFIYRHVLQFAL